jgi:hypothetical protein
MLKKDPGNITSTTCVICLLCRADLTSLYLQTCGPGGWSTTPGPCLGEEQGGSRPGRTAIDIANRKALTYLYTPHETCLGTDNAKIVLRSNYRLTRADSGRASACLKSRAASTVDIDKMSISLTAQGTSVLLLQRDRNSALRLGQERRRLSSAMADHYGLRNALGSK